MFHAQSAIGMMDIDLKKVVACQSMGAVNPSREVGMATPQEQGVEVAAVPRNVISRQLRLSVSRVALTVDPNLPRAISPNILRRILANPIRCTDHLL